MQPVAHCQPSTTELVFVLTSWQHRQCAPSIYRLLAQHVQREEQFDFVYIFKVENLNNGNHEKIPRADKHAARIQRNSKEVE